MSQPNSTPTAPPVRTNRIAPSASERAALDLHAGSEFRRSAERHRALRENEADAILFLNAGGHVTYASPAISHSLSRAPGTVVGMAWQELFHTEDHPLLERRLHESLRRPGIGVEFSGRVAHADGAWLRAEGAVTNLLTDPHVGALAFCFHVEPAPEDGTDEWQRIFEASPDMTVVLGRDGTVKRLNPAFARLLGLTGPEVRIAELHRLLHPDDRAATRAAFRQLRFGREVQGLENRWLCRTGAYRWFSWRARSVAADQSIYASGHEVTEQKRANEVLRRSELLFRQLADAMPQIVWTTGADGRTEYVNGHWIAYTGLSAADTHKRGAFAAVHPADAAKSAHLWARACRSGEPYEMELRLLRGRDSTYRWHLARAVCVREADGAITRWLGTATDIHDQKVVEEQLAEAQRIARIGSWRYDVATDRMTWSAELYRMFGLDPEASKLTYRNVALLLGVEKFDEHAATRLPKAAYERDQELELPDGSTRSCHFHAVVESDAAGQIERISGTVQDVTHLRAKERQISRQAELLNQTLDAILVWDLDGRIEFWNKGAERLFGWTADEAMGRPVQDFLRDEENREDGATNFLLESGEWSGEMRYRTKSDDPLILTSRWTLVPDDEGETRSILAVCTDITEQKRLESQFLRAQRLESMGTLASGVAHDLNNILAPILMAAPMLRDESNPQSRDSLVALIEASARRGASIVKQVLTFARGAEGERVLIQPKYLLNETLKISAETFPKTISIETDFPEDLWTLQGDPTHLHQVLLNLSVNARDAMPDGGLLTLHAENFTVDESYASMTPDAKPGPHVLIEVKDTGTGMPREIQSKIFDPFFTTKAPGQGTGLGLSTVMGLVRGHGGFITVYSEMGGGTSFKVFLPALPELAAETSVPAAAPDERQGEGELLLLVDDEPGLLSVASTLLSNAGYRVLTAADGPGAIALFAQHMSEVRAVVTDLMMPLMDGVTLIHAIRRMKPDVGIIASTGGTGAELRARDLAALHVACCLAKPYDRPRLLKAIHDVLRNPIPA